MLLSHCSFRGVSSSGTSASIVPSIQIGNVLRSVWLWGEQLTACSSAWLWPSITQMYDAMQIAGASMWPVRFPDIIFASIILIVCVVGR